MNDQTDIGNIIFVEFLKSAGIYLLLGASNVQEKRRGTYPVREWEKGVPGKQNKVLCTHCKHEYNRGITRFRNIWHVLAGCHLVPNDGNAKGDSSVR